MPYGYGFTYMIAAQVLFFIITISLIVWFVRTNNQKETPADILKKRFASGEINNKEYDIMLKKVQD